MSLALSETVEKPTGRVMLEGSKARDYSMTPHPQPTAGRGVALRAVIPTEAGSSPGEEACRRISPASFWDCTITIQRPLKARRWWALSGSWLLGLPLPTPITLARPRDLKHDLVVGHRHQAAVVIEHAAPRPAKRPRHRLRSRAGQAEARSWPARRWFRACRQTCLPSLKPRASSVPGL